MPKLITLIHTHTYTTWMVSLWILRAFQIAWTMSSVAMDADENVKAGFSMRNVKYGMISVSMVTGSDFQRRMRALYFAYS